MECLIAVASDDCAPTEMSCQCKNGGLNQALSDCMLAKCSMSETLGMESHLTFAELELSYACVDTAKIQANLCDFSHVSKTREQLIYTIVVYTIAAIFVGLRVAGKVLTKRLSPDDWVLVVAILLTAIPCGLVLASELFVPQF